MTNPKKNLRYSYLGINNREVYTWPNGTNLAVYIGLNLEHFSFGEGLGAELVPYSGAEPDILNYAWRDYGNRVGAWRLASLFNELSIPISLLVNTSIYDYCPNILTTFRKRGDEIVTSGGIVGTIEKVHDDDKIDLLISDNVTIKVIKSTVQSLLNTPNTKK